MLMEGVPPAMIENTARMAGMPVGPLSLNDEVAIDLALKIVKATKAQIGEAGIDPVQEKLLRRAGGKAGPARPQEPQGLLRLSREGAQDALAGAEGPADRQSRSGRARRHGAEAALSRRAGRRSRAARWRRVSSPTRARPTSAPSSASASRRSPGARCPTSTAWARRPSWRSATRSPNAHGPRFAPPQAPARDGREGRDVLRPLRGGSEGGVSPAPTAVIPAAVFLSPHIVIPAVAKRRAGISARSERS